MVKEEYNKVKLGPKKITVPSGWKIKDMKDLIKFKNGYAFSSNNYSENGKIVFRMSNINRKGNLNVNEENIKHCSEETYDELKRYHLAKDDLVICMTDMNSDLNILGRTGIIDKDNEYILNQRVGRMRVKNTDMVNFKYLHYFTNFKPYLDYIKATATGTAQYNTSTKTIKNTNVVLPPLFEQKKIASILSSVDKLIEKTDEVIEETKELKKGLMKELLTKGIGHSEFKELKFGPEIISLPLDWKILKLKEITDVRSSNVNKKSKNNERHIKLCNYTDVYYNEQINENIKFMEATAKDREIERFTLEKDDVIITKDSETPDDIGVPAVVTKDLSNILCGYHLALLKPNKKLIDGEFLSKMLQSKNITNQFYRLAQGLTRFGLRVTSIKNTKIPVPPLEEQKKIASILSSADAKIQKEEEYKSKLERLKKGLMQKLLTGEIRVNTEMEV
jgi:type I restriction enzyme S subunit